jgi:hypothetical protein
MGVHVLRPQKQTIRFVWWWEYSNACAAIRDMDLFPLPAIPGRNGKQPFNLRNARIRVSFTTHSTRKWCCLAVTRLDQLLSDTWTFDGSAHLWEQCKVPTSPCAAGWSCDVVAATGEKVLMSAATGIPPQRDTSRIFIAVYHWRLGRSI